MQLTGQLIQTTGVEQISETFKKTNVIIRTEFDSQYPQEISVECHNDNIAKLKDCGAAAGDVVTLDCNLRGKKYTKDGVDRWFNSIVMWKISKVGSAAPSQQTAPSTATTTAASATPDPDDDFPF
ncbi:MULTISPECIES: DUF3127 domain-containing protein [unclassified Pedobacter]|uniref:DUF3127 domain-containing protein n=1 Tax=unclassified Pedobacter TaxID=2628915 RepID=UPI001420BB7D|nr:MULTISPECIES: DUF3127 domain-containing protein [unclassified Pedobacter]NII81694.1 hypothetical protein [Pedobacter sp. SG908]NMN35698.1 hypothetical protein [Pedobacter sp. SG918]